MSADYEVVIYSIKVIQVSVVVPATVKTDSIIPNSKNTLNTT
jgi:hypothetical protein